MIQKESNLKPIDRCGVWSVRVFQLYGGSFSRNATVSGFVKISVKKTKPDNWIPPKTKLKAIIITVKKELSKLDGSYILFKENNTVLLKKRLTPKGKTIIGPASINVRRKRFLSSFCGSI